MVKWKSLLGIGILLLLVSTTWSASGTMSVQVRDGQLRATPSFLGTVVAVVGYADQVDVLQQQGDWMEVSCKGQKGWIHSSALTTKLISLRSGSTDAQTKASGRELALAGKGFNADVEAEYRRGHRNANFVAVDQMELVKIAPPEILAFLEKGGVKPGAGGGK
jgi:hypothetical protein